LENPNTATFDDFQWWSSASAFDKWLKENPRSWVADSEDVSFKYKSYEELIESVSAKYNLKYDGDRFDEADIIKSFESYIAQKGTAQIFEGGEPAAGGISMDARAREQIKVIYAYNKMKEEGKLSSFDANALTDSSKCVFTCIRDEAGNAKMQSLTAFKMQGYGKDSEKAKIKLVNIIDSRPEGLINEKTTIDSLTSGMMLGIAAVGGFSVGALAFGTGAISKGFEVVEGIKALKAIRGYAPGTKAVSSIAKGAKGANWVSKVVKGGKNGIKTVFGGVPFGSTIAVGKGIAQGVRTARAVSKLGGTTKNIVSAFGMGLTRGASAAGFKAIPFVGQVLAIAGAVGTLYNWNSNKQAPSYNEIKGQGFAHNEFNVKSVKIGDLITICWSQPAGGGWGMAVSFLWENDTRTTATMLKVADNGTSSIFVLVNIHAAELSKQLAAHDLILVSIVNEVYNTHAGTVASIRRLLDAEDIDFKYQLIDGIDKMATLFDFEGMCDWTEFLTYYDAASDQYIATDGKAPDRYLFYYKDQNGDHINVVGKILPNDKLKGISDADFDSIFNPTDARKKDYGITDTRGKKNESLDIVDADHILINESGSRSVITTFSDFQKGITRLVEKTGDEVKKQEGTLGPDETTVSPTASAESTEARTPEEDGPEEDDASNSDVSRENNELRGGSNQNISGPKLIAVYDVVAREYANPELRKYVPGVFVNFFINPADYEAKQGDKINVEVNSVYESIDNTRYGVYEYKKKKKKEDGDGQGGGSGNGETRVVTKPDDGTGAGNGDKIDGDKVETKKDDYYINVNPDDVSVKNKRNATIITDNNTEGGINIQDKFLTQKEREVLGIENWKSITTAKTTLDGNGDIITVKLKNGNAAFGNRRKTYKVTDGEPFQVAVKFAKEMEDRLRYR
jgi:hypothetical protein